MLLDLYILFNIVLWVLIASSVALGMFRRTLTSGKGLVVVMFVLSAVIALMLGFNSFFIEVPMGCTSTTCETQQFVYDYLAWFQWAIAMICVMFAFAFSFLTFGDLVKKS